MLIQRKYSFTDDKKVKVSDDGTYNTDQGEGYNELVVGKAESLMAAIDATTITSNIKPAMRFCIKSFVYSLFITPFFFSPLNTALSSSCKYCAYKEVKAPDKRPYSIEAEITKSSCLHYLVYSHHEEESRYIGNKD